MLEAVYYVTQIIAVGAILASLVAIYMQQRKDHILARADSQREVLQLNSNIFDSWADDPIALKSFQACLLDYETASGHRQVQFCKYMHQLIMVSEIAVFLDRDGLINKNSYDKIIAWNATLIGTPGGRQYWEAAGLAYSANVVEALNAYIGAHPIGLETVYEIAPFLRPDPEAPASADESEADQTPES